VAASAWHKAAIFSPTLSCTSSIIANSLEVDLIASITSSCIKQPDIAVYVPAALMNVRMPSSLNKSRFGAGGEGGEARTESNGKALPIITPDTGRMDRFLITSLRFILVGYYFDNHVLYIQ
jgi:hypothetical protein